MRIGIIADIHEDVTLLKAALHVLDNQTADIIIALGDIAEYMVQIEETTQILLDAGAIGVWGNHDWGLCYDPAPSVFEGFAPCVHEFMTSLKPTLQIEDCFFSHVEPWLDPYKLEDLWRDPYQFTLEEHITRSFHSKPERVLFYGHIHCWRIATPTGIVDWEGDHMLLHHPERYLVTLAPLSDGIASTIHRGHLALYDTETQKLIRFRV